MVKVLLSVLAVIISTAGCSVGNGVSPNTPKTNNMQTSSGLTSIEEKILKHAESNFSLAKAEADLKKISSLNLPEETTYYYLEKKGSYGSTYYNYFVYKNELFCSGIEGDFERYLKALNFLSAKNVTAEQFWNSYQQLGFHDGESMIIDEKLLSQPYEFVKPFINRISKPELDYQNGSATFIFYSVNTDNESVTKNVVEVSSDYKVSKKSERLK